MFGRSGAHEATTTDVMLLAVQAAILCRAGELENCKSHSDQRVVRTHLNDLASESGKSFSSTAFAIAENWVLKLLIEDTFITQLLKRAEQGPLSITPCDEEALERILPEGFN
jgi:hypothetical protein